MNTQKPKIAVILGSVREGRAGEKVAKWFMEAVGQNPHAELQLVDLLDYPVPIFMDSDTVRHRQGKHPNPVVQNWLDVIDSAQGYIFISPEYNRGVSSVLKNAIDYGYKEWNGKPIGIVSYGGWAGGARSAEQLRSIAAELQMYDVRDQVVISRIWQAFDEKGQLKDGETLAKTANAIVDKVSELALKLQAQPVLAY